MTLFGLSPAVENNFWYIVFVGIIAGIALIVYDLVEHYLRYRKRKNAELVK